MKFIRTLLILTLFPVIIPAKAQKVWSLEECIDYAYTNNIQIKQQSLNIELAEDNLLQSKAGILPNLNANASHSYNYGRTVDRFTNQFATERVQSNNFYISSGVTLFEGFRLLNTIKQNQLNLLASKYDVDKMKNDISLNIATAYLQILFNQELLDVAQSQSDISRQQLERTKKLVDAGTLARGSLLNMEAQVASEELQVIEAQNNLDLSYLTLTQMLDLPSAEEFEIVKPTLNIMEDDLVLSKPDDIYTFALTNQPEIKSAEINVQSSQKGLAIARGSRSPSLSLSGSYGTGYSGASQNLTGVKITDYAPVGYTTGGDTVLGPVYDYTYETKPFNDQINDNLNKSIGLNLSIPIFNSFQARTSVSRAEIAMKNAEYKLQLIRNQLNKDIQQAHADAKAALNKYHASRKNVDALQESFRYTEQKFNIGMVNSVEYNDAKNKLIKAKSDLLQAKYEYVFRIKVLDFYQGKPITLTK